MGTSFSHALFPYTQRICLFNYLASATHSHALNLHNMQNLLLRTFSRIFAISSEFLCHITQQTDEIS